MLFLENCKVQKMSKREGRDWQVGDSVLYV